MGALMESRGIWVVLLIAILLFGSRRLPDAARGLGRSLRIFKAETKGLLADSADAPAVTAAAPAPLEDTEQVIERESA